LKIAAQEGILLIGEGKKMGKRLLDKFDIPVSGRSAASRGKRRVDSVRDLPGFGIWKDRPEMKDALAAARRLRCRK